MKNKIIKLIAILAVVSSVFIIIYTLIEIKKLKDPNSLEYCIAVYENEPSNNHLIGLCNKLSVEKDKRLFDYFDDFMNMENFNDEVKNCENGNISDAEIDYYHDFMITNALKICAENNDIDLFSQIILKYYPKIRDKDKLFYLSLSNDDSTETTEFFKANADKIVDTLETLYTQEDNSKLKLRYLLEIKSYYFCDEVKNIELYEEKHGDELAELMKECVSDSDIGKVATLSAYFQSYWEHLLTGKDNEGWNLAYQETLSKKTQVTVLCAIEYRVKMCH